jgi:HAMP domain-containing protein
MRFRIGFKIFGIAVGLLILMGGVALVNLHMTRTVNDQLEILRRNYDPAYISLVRANIYSERKAEYLRRVVIAYAQTPRDDGEIAMLRERMNEASGTTDDELIEARQHINEQIADPLDFNDVVALTRTDMKISFLQDARKQDKAIIAHLLSAADAGDQVAVRTALADQDRWRDDFDQRLDDARLDMNRLSNSAIVGTQAYQNRLVQIGFALLLLAGLLGAGLAAAITTGLVRPVRRLLTGTVAVERGALDTIIPVTSSDEIGRLTESFNKMVGELRVKERIRDTFGKYIDPRIVAGLIDRPELTDPKGARREMTILFCDMQDFTTFSEGMTPVGLVNVMNRYLTVLSEPVRRNSGIIDKYIGDAVMAFWGPLALRRSSSSRRCRRSRPSCRS